MHVYQEYKGLVEEREVNMIITLSGVAGAGKSYYKKYLVENLGIENMVIYTTRPRRENEINGVDKHFVTKQEIDEKLKQGSLFTSYHLLGTTYAYDRKYLEENMHSVTELHYEWILDFKQKVKDIFSIYILPNNIETIKRELQRRGFSKEMYDKRIEELEEYQKRMKEDKEFQKAFDVVFYNHYDQESEQRMLQLVKDKLKG